MDAYKIREKIVELCLTMNANGLNQGTAGNISVRCDDRMLITPSGIPYDTLLPEHIASMPIDGSDVDWIGPYAPSSEWHFHRAILQRNPDFGTVIHTHSMYATILSIGRRDIQACHYMIAAFGGSTVRCADYATFGTKELSANIQIAMRDRSACLLSNHGMVVAEANPDKCMWAAIELETLAQQFYYAELAGSITLLDDTEIETVKRAFENYGPKEL